MLQPLRIALFSEHASPLAVLGSTDAGGQNVYVDQLSRNLGALGHRVDVFTRRDDRALPEVVASNPGVRVIHLRAGPAARLSKDALWPYMPELRDSFYRFNARDGASYDALHGNFWMSGWVVGELRHRLGIPAVQIFHALGKTKQRHQGVADTSPTERIAVETATVRGLDRLIAQCPAERAELLDDYGADPARVAVVPSAVNTELFRPVPQAEARRQIGIEGDAPTMVYVGRLLPRKDVRNVVRALALLRQGGVAARLLVVGGDSREPNAAITPEIGVLRELAAELGVAAHVQMVGSRQPEELCSYYSAGDVVVTTPWYEPFGLTPLEGQACGRPVIGAAVGGISFTIADGQTGSLVPPRDPAALAVALRQLLLNPERCAAMGAAARARVEQEFTWPTVARRTAALYHELVAERTAPLERAYGAD